MLQCVGNSRKAQGVTLILSILVLGAVGVAIAVSMTIMGINRVQTSYDFEQQTRAQSMAVACVEEALEQIRNDSDYTGDGSLSLGDDSCEYTVLNAGGGGRTIEATGVVDNVTRKAEVDIRSVTPDIIVTSFQEVTSFSSEGGGGGCTTCRIFVTDGVWTGNLGGISGADAKCQADIHHPGGGATFKALLAYAGEREIGQDWVLQADTPYYRVDGTTLVDTTDSQARLTFDLDVRVMATEQQENGWTGLNTDFTESTYTCSGWTNGSSGESGTESDVDSLDSLFVHSVAESICDNTRTLVCIEQ